MWRQRWRWCQWCWCSWWLGWVVGWLMWVHCGCCCVGAGALWGDYGKWERGLRRVLLHFYFQGAISTFAVQRLPLYWHCRVRSCCPSCYFRVRGNLCLQGALLWIAAYAAMAEIRCIFCLELVVQGRAGGARVLSSVFARVGRIVRRRVGGAGCLCLVVLGFALRRRGWRSLVRAGGCSCRSGSRLCGRVCRA